ncbi:MAG: hypothetical protein R3A52_13375 [Polyangiales bacterium]
MTIETCPDLTGFFRSAVETALRRRRVDAAAPTAEYVTGLRVACATRDPREVLERPLVELRDAALCAAEAPRRVELQAVGDVALTRAGLFGDHVARHEGVLELYVTMGAFAYREAATMARASAGSAPVAIEEIGGISAVRPRAGRGGRGGARWARSPTAWCSSTTAGRRRGREALEGARPARDLPGGRGGGRGVALSRSGA